MCLLSFHDLANRRELRQPVCPDGFPRSYKARPRPTKRNPVILQRGRADCMKQVFRDAGRYHTKEQEMFFMEQRTVPMEKITN